MFATANHQEIYLYLETMLWYDINTTIYETVNRKGSPHCLLHQTTDGRLEDISYLKYGRSYVQGRLESETSSRNKYSRFSLGEHRKLQNANVQNACHNTPNASERPCAGFKAV